MRTMLAMVVLAAGCGAPLGAVNFKGVIENSANGMMADGAWILRIGGKSVVIGAGLSSVAEWGSLSMPASCRNEGCVGHTAEVLALPSKIGFTLAGSEDLYVRVLE